MGHSPRLRETGSFLVGSIRAEDFVCRCGGEEFVVVLPTADLRAARSRAERIRSKLRELVVMHQGRSAGVIIASVGVAALPDHGTSEKDLLQATDAALYRAKREGRDRVVLAQSALSADVQAPSAGLRVERVIVSCDGGSPFKQNFASRFHAEPGVNRHLTFN